MWPLSYSDFSQHELVSREQGIRSSIRIKHCSYLHTHNYGSKPEDFNFQPYPVSPLCLYARSY